MPIFWNANHATIFITLFSIRESREEDIIYPQSLESRKLRLSKIECNLPKFTSEFRTCYFSSKSISHASFLLKILHRTPQCLSIYWIYTLLKTFILVLRDVIFFNILDSSCVDLSSFSLAYYLTTAAITSSMKLWPALAGASWQYLISTLCYSV